METNVYYHYHNECLWYIAMPQNIDTALLRALVAVAETGGMTSAGRLLHLTQAAVSQQIKRLEDLFQQKLFERGHRELRLTPTGERLLPRAERIIAMNDEVWGVMMSPDFEGEIRIGVPQDIVKSLMPPVLRSFHNTWPRIHVAVIPNTSPRLLDALDKGTIDLTLTTEMNCGPNGEILMPDNLVWVGARNGQAHERTPLPVSLADKTCMFRQSALSALARANRDWRLVCEDSNMLAVYAALEADLGVAPMLVSSIPDNLQQIGDDSGLPHLPRFSINMYLPKANPSEVAIELAQHIRDQFASRYARTG